MLPSVAVGPGIRMGRRNFRARWSWIGSRFIRRNRIQNSELRIQKSCRMVYCGDAGVGENQLGGTPMQFLIHGADQKTGREMTIVVDARDQTEAEQRVLYNIF